MWLIALKILWELEMGAFAQRPKRALVVGHVGVTIYPEAQKKHPRLAVRSGELYAIMALVPVWGT